MVNAIYLAMSSKDQIATWKVNVEPQETRKFSLFPTPLLISLSHSSERVPIPFLTLSIGVFVRGSRMCRGPS